MILPKDIPLKHLYDIPADKLFLISQKAVIISRGKLLLIKEVWNEKWSLPGGLLEIGEAPELGLRREVREEIGCSVTIGPMLGASAHWHPNFHMKDGRVLKARVYRVFYRCTLASKNIRLSHEHTDLRWATKKDISHLRLQMSEKEIIYHALHGKR